MKTTTSLVLATSLCAMSLARAAGHAHVHGIASLDVAVEAHKLTLQLSVPLDNLLGFERAPRSDAERRQTDAVVAKLRQADTVFRIDPAARCQPAGVTLTSAALKLGTPDPEEAQEEGHADIDASYEFTCADGNRAAYVETSLFDFQRLQRLDVQIAGPSGQLKRTLKRPERRILLSR